MAFPFSNPSPFATSTMAPTSGQAQNGPDLEEINTEGVGFRAIAGDTKLRLLPDAWPSDALPPPTASLLSVASRKGLLAAAGPESVIIASTEAVRQAYNAPDGGDIKPFDPQLTLNLGMRISQVAFSANEEHLILCAESGGGLAGYQVQSLMQGEIQRAFEMATNGVGVRELLPNPTSAEFFAVVTTNGQLMIANLQSRQFVTGSQGEVLREGVSCVSWSNKGKQIIAGLANGACVQMTPEGVVKGELPAPSNLQGEQHVSSLNWLENDIFLTGHTPSASEPGTAPETTFHIVTRSKQPEQPVLYQKLSTICEPFGLDRSPPSQFIRRLREFPPNLTDAIVVTSTASTDVSLVTRSKSPLGGAAAVNVFATTMMADDSRRAQLPMTKENADTSPIGVAFDLSSKENVKRPLPKEEYEESSNPLPALMILNNQCVLAAWWFIYTESIRQGTAYPGLTVASGSSTQQPQGQRQASPFGTAPSLSSPAFSQSSFGKPSTPLGSFGAANNNSTTPAFGSTAVPSSAFGAPSALTQKASPWGGNTGNNPSSTPAFGQPSFGSISASGGTAQGSTFGMAGGLGNRASPWGSQSSGTATATGDAFGQAGKLGTPASPFGSNVGASSTPTSGGFASFANSKGFAAAPPSSDSTQSIFGKPLTGGAFASSNGMATSFGQPEKADEAKSLFGNGGFRLGSTFKGDGTAADDAPKPRGTAANSLFGNNFGTTLGNAATTQSKDADMDEGGDESSQSAQIGEQHKQSEPSVFKPAPPKFQFPKAETSKSGGLFGTSAQDPAEAATKQGGESAGFSFGSVNPASSEQQDQVKAEARSRPSVESSPKIKDEPQSDDGGISPLNEDEAKPPEGYDSGDERPKSTEKETPETPVASRSHSPESPVPPESTSKTTYAPGDSSDSSKASDDAPLPPDFAPAKSKLHEVEAAPPAQSALPDHSAEEHDSEEEGEVQEDQSGPLDDEGSGVDVAQEISPASSKESSKHTPDSSFGIPADKGSPENMFSTAQQQANSRKIPLFGELGKPPVPLFPPTKPQESPRSPSPVRLGSNLDTLRPESSRSLSAPGPVKTPAPKPKQSAKEIRNRERERLLAERNKLFDEEHQVLSDDDDDENKRILEMEVVPSRALDKFVAHQDYVGQTEKPGIPGQIEKVFRDINSMIDTLGLNSRSLLAFTKAHESRPNSEHRDRSDLESLDDWCLIEIEDLDRIEEDMLSNLDKWKLQGVSEKLASIGEMHGALSQIRRQSHDLSRTISLSKDPANLEAAAQKPLNLDQQTQLKDLRKAFKQFQQQLAEAEKDIVILRTKLASQSKSQSVNGRASLKQPTVEKVENTIRKMTNMVIQKNEDIDLLSSQLNGLRFPSPSNSGLLDDTGSRSSREGSPSIYSTAYTSKRSRNPLGRSGYGSRMSMSSYNKSPLRDGSSVNGNLPDVTSFLSKEEIEEHRVKAKRRRDINDVVKSVFGKSGVRVRALD